MSTISWNFAFCCWASAMSLGSPPIAFGLGWFTHSRVILSWRSTSRTDSKYSSIRWRSALLTWLLRLLARSLTKSSMLRPSSIRRRSASISAGVAVRKSFLKTAEGRSIAGIETPLAVTESDGPCVVRVRLS